MTSSSASSCTSALLVLLLPLLLCVHRSSCAALPRPAGASLPPCISSMFQLKVDINYLGNSVNHCSTNCSLPVTTDPTCQCFNATASQECGPVGFLRSGLSALLLRLKGNFTVSSLIKRLKHLSKDCKGKATFCSLRVPSQVLISPKSFQEKMKLLVQMYNDALHA